MTLTRVDYTKKQMENSKQSAKQTKSEENLLALTVSVVHYFWSRGKVESL